MDSSDLTESLEADVDMLRGVSGIAISAESLAGEAGGVDVTESRRWVGCSDGLDVVVACA